MTGPQAGGEQGGGHPPLIRLTHWINVFAMTCMVMSGAAIYNADPILPFHFPLWATLGGWLGGSTIWHFSAMWLLVANGLAYGAYGLASGHLRRRLWPVGPRAVLRDLGLALHLRLPHDGGGYNAVQRAAYLAVLLLGVLMVASGLAIWKPVQLWWLTWCFGGFDRARIVHFAGMAGILGFAAVHIVMVALVPRTLATMTLGTPLALRRKAPPP